MFFLTSLYHLSPALPGRVRLNSSPWVTRAGCAQGASPRGCAGSGGAARGPPRGALRREGLPAAAALASPFYPRPRSPGRGGGPSLRRCPGSAAPRGRCCPIPPRARSRRRPDTPRGCRPRPAAEGSFPGGEGGRVPAGGPGRGWAGHGALTAVSPAAAAAGAWPGRIRSSCPSPRSS